MPHYSLVYLCISCQPVNNKINIGIGIHRLQTSNLCRPNRSSRTTSTRRTRRSHLQFKNRLRDQKRAKLVEDVAEAQQEFSQGKCKSVTPEQIMEEIFS
jgi:hypothetical protein